MLSTIFLQSRCVRSTLKKNDWYCVSYKKSFQTKVKLNRVRYLNSQMVQLPKFTSDNCRILLLRLINSDPNLMKFDDALTVFTMMNDTMSKTPDAGRLADGEVLVFDLKCCSLGHLTKLSLSSLRCFIKYLIEAHPLRIKEVHLTNFEPWIEKFFMLTRPFIGEKAMKRFHFHEPNSETLFEFIPKDLLPDVLDGTAGSIEEAQKFWTQCCSDNRCL